MYTSRTQRHHRQRRLVIEADGVRDIALSPGSVDTQIDSLLASFEKDASEMEEAEAIVPEGRSIAVALRRLIEAEDESESDITDDERQKTDEPADPPAVQVNVSTFATKVATLIESYQQRLDVETVIFNRALNYMRDNHGEEAAAEFTQIIKDEHGVELQGDEDITPVKYGVGSGPS